MMSCHIDTFCDISVPVLDFHGGEPWGDCGGGGGGGWLVGIRTVSFDTLSFLVQMYIYIYISTRVVIPRCCVNL